VLIATDVAARGIDVDDVTHVINHTIPEDEKTYLHRAGRTGRAGKTGIAVTFVDWADMHKWALINRALEMGIPEPTETYSSSPHLYEELNIPVGAKGRLKSTPAAPHVEREPRESRDSGSGGSGSSRSGSGDRPPRQRSRSGGSGSSEGGGTTATGAPRQEGGGTHDGASPTRRRRTRRRGAGSGGASTPPAA
jgi:superfamily II DNA/RNA helicase